MNNSFSECIADICGLELAALVGNYKYSVFGGHTVVLEGHKGISSYCCDAVSFKVAGGYLKICGDGLRIRCLEKNFAVVSGKIDGVSVGKEN